MSDIKEVVIFTDGACSPNPGTGGYGIVLLYGTHRKELSRGFLLTTNNRMELLAAVVALEALKETCKVKLYSDSKYVVEPITLGWIERWKSKNWRKVKNPDLWVRLLDQCEKHQVEFLWVKGHSGNVENERCDELAVQASKSKNLTPDEFYESNYAKEKIIADEESFNGNTLSTSKGNQKITMEGQSCRKCLTPVVKHFRRKDKPIKASRAYYYKYFFICPQCRTYYYVEDAIEYIEKPKGQLKLF